VFVMTIDQRGSRRGPDLVDRLLEEMAGRPGLVRGFERTAGDEVQGLLDDATVVVDLALRLARAQVWSIGIGAGAVREPVPASVRAGAGPAFELARNAVERAKSVGPHCEVQGEDAGRAREAGDLLGLLATLVQRRSKAGWEVVDLLAQGLTQREVASRLGITTQAVNQRARTAWWQHEHGLRPLAARLLAEAAA